PTLDLPSFPTRRSSDLQHDGNGPVLVVDGLAAGDEVDDAEPAVSERGAAARRDVLALAVGPAMGERTSHRAKRLGIDGAVPVQRDRKSTRLNSSHVSIS